MPILEPQNVPVLEPPNFAKPSVGNSLLDELASSHGSFGRFWQVLHEQPYVGSGPRTPSCKKESRLFPSLLVLPVEPSNPHSARSRARRRGRETSWEWTKMIWCLFTFLEGGMPFKREDQLALAHRARAAQWGEAHITCANRLHAQVQEFVCLRVNEPLSRGSQKLSEFIDRIRPDNSNYNPGPYNLEELSKTAMPVKPERMSLPEEAGIIDPRDFLKGRNLEIFTNMAEVVPHDIPPPNPTKAVLKIAPEDKQRVYRKLINSGVATLIPSEMALRDERGNIVSGGLFAVPHKTETDRVILDRRPMNELEKRVVMAKLPHGSLFIQIILPKNSSIRASGDDLSNYF